MAASFLITFSRNVTQCCYTKPRHLICFKQWTADMVMDVINSAIILKSRFRDTHCQRLDILNNCKVTILKEVNEPALNLAVSKAATFMGAYDVTVVDNLIWENDYLGRNSLLHTKCRKKNVSRADLCHEHFLPVNPQEVQKSWLEACKKKSYTEYKVFSLMSDVIFVSTATHTCMQRFADKSTVPVLSMKSRTHASIQALSTIMAIIEEFTTMRYLNISYIGAPDPVLNSYLLLCPMLGANIKFICCCQKSPVSPLLYKASEELVQEFNTISQPCTTKNDLLCNTQVVIAGPTPKNKNKIKDFKVDVQDITNCTSCHWIFFHTFPRGEEVDDCLFDHCNARTFNAFENMQFIAASLMAYSIKNYRF